MRWWFSLNFFSKISFFLISSYVTSFEKKVEILLFYSFTGPKMRVFMLPSDEWYLSWCQFKFSSRIKTKIKSKLELEFKCGATSSEVRIIHTNTAREKDSNDESVESNELHHMNFNLAEVIMYFCDRRIETQKFVMASFMLNSESIYHAWRQYVSIKNQRKNV